MAVRLLVLLILLCALPAAAEIYKQVDENGKVTYSDTPSGTQVQQVDLPPVNTQPATRVKLSPPSDDSEQTTPQYWISITEPVAESHIPAGQRDVEVAVLVEPRLRPGHSLQAYINGKPFGPATRENRWLLLQLYRGEHQLSIAAQDSDGNTLAKSAPVTVYVFRPSVNRTRNGSGSSQ